MNRFLLRKTSKGYEFIHRLVRDHFAVLKLVPALASASETSRMEIILSLGKQGEAALEVLEELTNHEDPAIRSVALSACGQVPSIISVQCFRHHINDPDKTVGLNVFAHCLKLYNTVGIHVLTDMLPRGDCSEIAPIFEAFASSFINRETARSLLWSVGRRAVPSMVGYLSAPNLNVRLLAMEILFLRKAKYAIDALIPLLGDSEPRIRAGAVSALGATRDASAIDAIRLLSNDPDANVRQAVNVILAP